MLNLILAEASLELLPSILYGHRTIKKLKKSGKKPYDVLLDRSIHHFAMVDTELEFAQKRGRPDIVHISLVNALATPLYQNNLVRIFVHTVDNSVILIGEKVRIPKSYPRFEGLMLTLFKNKSIVSEEGKVLLKLQKNLKIKYLLREIVKPDLVVGLSTTGSFATASKVAQDLTNAINPCLIIGGFPRDHFSESVESCFDKKFSIHNGGLETQVVVSRLIYEYEKNVLT
ncbi:ribosome biogenesis protein [Candidatus Nitrosocosmicus sp. SS]|uniref:ribosome biogenesis protein n=1 Tax=Candidatus Nitrosocosmicus agrestis TaxID=2563600 RepID=UPI00122E03D0|nr:ribosome biogenesis protein [Candidatus Nitrosocosmicus sp. SS]KAA2281142.1 ribosome biogenesis protein [Candidatus Nitrosocosmicus sp. SS]KAF0869442.1 ribosome biogenesis protein [Candidatus Nitrosocosmicus sp. SS]